MFSVIVDMNIIALLITVLSIVQWGIRVMQFDINNRGLTPEAWFFAWTVAEDLLHSGKILK